MTNAWKLKQQALLKLNEKNLVCRRDEEKSNEKTQTIAVIAISDS